MIPYPKIKTVFERDPKTNYKTLIWGKWAYTEFKYLQNNEWIWTEKVDGTNIRTIFYPDKAREITDAFEFKGRTERAEIPIFLLERLKSIFFPLCDKMCDIFNREVCLYGEGYGAKIQKGGGNYRSDQGFVLFDIRIGKWWLTRRDVEDIAMKLGLEVVPIVDIGTLWEMVEKVKAGFRSMWGDFLAEGVVAKPLVELQSRSGERIITKLKYKDFVREEN